MGKFKNVVVLLMDTARADSCEPFAPVGATPTVAQLGRSGRALPWVRSTSNWTVPGHASLFSGDLPRQLGVTQILPKERGCRQALTEIEERWLPDVLQRAGYVTAGVSTNLWITKRTGFARGFDSFDRVDSPRSVKIRRKDLRSRLTWKLEGLAARVDDGAEEAWRTVSAWLAQRDAQPFFLFVNLIECHSPYLPPRPYNDLSMRNRLRAAEEAKEYLTRDAIWRANLGGLPIPDDALARMRHLYGRSIRSMDDWLSRLLDELAGSGRLDETLVIVTSDHGENFGENGLLGHCFSLDDRLLRVPFVVSDPDFPEISSLAAVPAAIASQLGIGDHPFGEVSNGIAVAQIDAMADREDPQLQSVRREWDLDESAVAVLASGLTSASDRELKLVRRTDGHEALYDVSADPLEEHPLDIGAALTNGIGPRVRALRAAVEDGETVAEHHEPQAGRSLAVETDDDEADDIAARMELLGYL